jgi:hypothetical protein
METVRPDQHSGTFEMRELGSTTSGVKGLDDNKSLQELKFVIGDYIDVAVRCRPLDIMSAYCVGVSAGHGSRWCRWPDERRTTRRWSPRRRLWTWWATHARRGWLRRSRPTHGRRTAAQRTLVVRYPDHSCLCNMLCDRNSFVNDVIIIYSKYMCITEMQ